MSEIWKPVAGYAGAYEISNLGRVKSVARTIEIKHANGPYTRCQPERILKPAPTQPEGGYLAVILRKDGISYGHSIHRLVANAFIPNPNNLPVVMHKDDNSFNNKVTNLCWGTQQDNVDDMITKNRNSTTLSVDNVRKIKAALKRGISTEKLASRFDVSRSTISNIANGVGWKHVK